MAWSKCVQNTKLTSNFSRGEVEQCGSGFLGCSVVSITQLSTVQNLCQMRTEIPPTEIIKSGIQFLHYMYVHTHLYIYCLNVFSLLPDLLQGIRNQCNQIAQCSTFPYQIECDIFENCSVASHSLSRCTI